MEYFDLAVQLILLIVGSGFLGYCGKWLHKHHKANRTANALDLAQNIAKWSVARVANDSNLAMGQRRTAVVRELQDVLTKHGYHFEISRLVGLAEITYQIYKANGHNIVKPQPKPLPTEDNTPDSPEHPGYIEVKNTGEANYKSGLSSDELDLLNNYRAKKAANK